MAKNIDYGRAVLVIGAGAPHSSLMAGALCAVWKAGRTFHTIYTAGAGGLMGMLFAAPANGDPEKALRSVPNMGVSDEIYQWFPVNYKAFFKSSPYTQAFRHWARRFHIPESHGEYEPYSSHGGGPWHPWPPFGWWPFWWPFFPGHHHHHHHSAYWRRLYNDWIDLWFSALTPTDLAYSSEGLCDPLPFLEEMVSFKALKYFHGDFYLNAYNITRDRVDLFAKDVLTPLHFRAALASPFIYPPVTIGDQTYYEGADRSPIPFHHFKDIRLFPKVGIVAIMDILGALGKSLVRRPRNLWDAYLISIVTPIVSLAKRDLGSFTMFLDEEADKRDHGPKLHHELFDFRVPADLASNLLDWRYSNLRHLWDIGYEAGERFIHDFGKELPLRPKAPPEPES